MQHADETSRNHERGTVIGPSMDDEDTVPVLCYDVRVVQQMAPWHEARVQHIVHLHDSEPADRDS